MKVYQLLWSLTTARTSLQKSLEEWLNGLGCRHLFTAPRHPQSNGFAENFVRTLKSALPRSLLLLSWN
ncbi:hypothetical protein CLF_113131 [Clonorchis sinensis]|uniref:Integrase catalytic domain-containing protein n=1 Tax=Clonorchis sinensis TaxID=79923 RepID=G7YXQ0_CLOSI|nr:hypothetical protein CLF_113131 [Clonorchis sinensis]